MIEEVTTIEALMYIHKTDKTQHESYLFIAKNKWSRISEMVNEYEKSSTLASHFQLGGNLSSYITSILRVLEHSST